MSRLGSDEFRRRAQEEAERARQREASAEAARQEAAQEAGRLAAASSLEEARLREERRGLLALGRDIAALAKNKVPFNRRWEVSGKGQTFLDRRAKGRILDEAWALAFYFKPATWTEAYDGTNNAESSELLLFSDGELRPYGAAYGANQDNFHDLHVTAQGDRHYVPRRERDSEAMGWGAFSMTEVERALAEFVGRHNLV